MKKVYLLFISALLANVASAQITTTCQQESGSTKCTAIESNVNVMSVKCNNSNVGTSCAGDYKDKTSGKLQMHCNHSESGMLCHGNATDGTFFNLNCSNVKNGLMACNISDNQGESLTMSCKIGEAGMPNCFGKDNDGQKHDISCQLNASGQKTCVTN